MNPFDLWGRATLAMIPPRPLREGQTLGPQALLVVGGGASRILEVSSGRRRASGGWRRPSAV
ncbi:UNVERIFIED_CONTAM: hypothetical protein Sradi_2015800 [Sesamum radiatum]|uniref:Uncharacterized protein n=1 Tax=Sesamum radiatum TaxID=300843 RepID=A0AAW2TFL4_SESRA